MNDPGIAREVKFSLNDPTRALSALGLLGDRKSFLRQAGGFLIRCPVHQEKTPSCSVQLRSGVLLWKCHGCDASGDVLDLVAAVHGLTMRGDDFRQVLIHAAALAGLHGIVHELETGSAPVERKPIAPRPEPAPEPEREYPPVAEVTALLDACVSVTADAEVSAWLTSRKLKPKTIERADAVFALPKDATIAGWASYRGQTWAQTGHRLIIPMHDAAGIVRSVRAGRVVEGDSPKRLPPAGCRASGTVMACAIAVGMLRGTFAPELVTISEGEPDWLSWVEEPGTYARIGITNGGWSDDIANRIPNGTRVAIRTDNDTAGDRYAAAIVKSLRGRCPLKRSQS